MAEHDNKAYVTGDEKAASAGSDNAPVYERGEANLISNTHNNDDYYGLSFWGRMGVTPESFKRRIETDANRHNKLNQTMKGRHLTMIAIGGSIGAGLFVGTGSALRRGGPASLLIDYSIIGIMMFNVVFALGELALMYPVSGGFYVLVTRFVDPSWGFAMGWNYFLQWFFILPFEIVVASFTIDYWTEGKVSPAIFMAVFLIALTIISVFGTLGYAEEEFLSSALKLSAIVTFLIIGLVLVLGGGPSSGRYSEYWGNRHFQVDNGGFKNGFKGFCSVFVTAAFAFAGTELIGLAASESATPLQTLPSACKQVFWRITLFYILSLLFVGLLISADDPNLIGANAFANSQASPFVLVGKYAGLVGYDHFINAVIMISVISIGLSGVYGGSRTLTAMAEQGYAPKFFDYVDRAGRPLFSTILVLAVGCIAFAGVDQETGVELFDWLLAISGLAALFTWGSICLAHIRFRMAWKRQGRTLDEIPFKAAGGVIGSYIGLIMCILVFIAQMYVAIWPIGGGVNTAQGFFKSCLAFPVVVFFWVAGYIWKRPKFLTIANIDLDSGRREIDWELHRSIQEKRARAGIFMKIIYKLF
ncbi:amino-acid permease inda1 [Paramyrothecium foliicola]|nr:amino-acid permease inda1 [Paramyrothecium foliicola]